MSLVSLLILISCFSYKTALFVGVFWWLHDDLRAEAGISMSPQQNQHKHAKQSGTKEKPEFCLMPVCIYSSSLGWSQEHPASRQFP